MDDKLEHIYMNFSEYKNNDNKSLSTMEKINEFHYYLPFLLLVEQFGFVIEYGGEKTAWTIFFNYKEYPFIITLRKSGLFLFGLSEKKEIIINLIKTLIKSKKIIDDVYQNKIKEKISLGKVTIQNSFNFFLGRYNFNLDLFRKIETGEYIYKKNMIKKIQMLYAYIGVIDSWFAWLEHTCILLLAVSNIDYKNDDIIKFVGKNWTKKYNRIFEQSQNKFFAKKYNELKVIKEKIRNTYSHGGIRKMNSEIMVHWEGIGAIPYILSDTEIYPDIKYQGFFHDYNADIKVLEEFNNEFENGDMALKYKLLQSGLDIYFSEKNIEDMIIALKNKNDLYKYLDYECGYQDAIQNYDL